MAIEQIGIIGLGDMGIQYAKAFSSLGYDVNGCDLPENRSRIEQELDGTNVKILDDGVAVSRRSDLIFYLVEAEKMDKAVGICGSSTKKNSIVSAGTSVMTPAVEAFQKYLPANISIANWHWMFGPSVVPKGKNSALVNVRGSEDDYSRVREACEKVETNIIEFDTYQDHDKTTADTQAATHVGYESMGTAWMKTRRFPWENSAYVGGIDNVKVLMTMRLFGGKDHVYSGLAILNPFAREQVRQYEKSVTELFELMIQGKEQEFMNRIIKIGDHFFTPGHGALMI